MPAFLRQRETRTACILVLLLVAFGVVVEIRSAFLKRRMTDLGVYLRAAWAVRSGEDLYRISDDNSWHYNYPPLFAILMAPLADPPAGTDRTGYLPFAVSTAVWYVFSVCCVFCGCHLLARAVEKTSSNQEVRAIQPGCPRWSALRLWPILLVIPALGATLVRGQVNLLVLLLLCASAADTLRRRPIRAGFWLGGAICLKLIPAFLLLYPLWRRDSRWLAGTGLGLLVGLVIIPMAAFGPQRTWSYYQEWQEVLLKPAFNQGGDTSRAHELTGITATDSQSLMATIHNTLHPDRATRPLAISTEVRRTHWVLGSLLTILNLLAAGWRRTDDSRAELLFFGSLTALMPLLSPVCHLHYFCFWLPLFLALIAVAWEPLRTHGQAPLLGKGLVVLFTVVVTADAVSHLPTELLRDGGVAMYGGLLLWAAGCVALWKRRRVRGVEHPLVPTRSVGTPAPTLCVASPARLDAERPDRAFPRGAWERGKAA